MSAILDRYRSRRDPEAKSPEWWLNTLNQQLVVRQPRMLLMDRFYYGDHPPPFLTRSHDAKMRNEFRELLDDSRSNFMRLVVDVVEERLRVEGFRLSAANDVTADERSWEIWQANCLDAESQVAIVEALVKGVSYLSVWADTDGDGYPDICVEDPLQTIVGYEPGTNFRERAAALKMWRDDYTGKDRANVYMPDGVYKFEATDARRLSISGSPAQVAAAQVVRSSGWKELEDEFLPNPFGVVPIIPLRNRPRLLLEGESEIADVYRIQNQLNGFLFLLALAGYFGAHKQRWAVGLKIMEDANGKPVEPFDVAVDRLLQTENPNAKFGEFSQTDLSGYISALEQKTAHIAITTRTPKHYMLPSGQEPSGDAIKSAESGLVMKVERKMRPFGEAFEETIRVARQFAGEDDAPVDSEIVWADPRIRTEAEITDAAIKRYAGGLVPWEQTMEDLGYTQTQIARMKDIRDAEAAAAHQSELEVAKASIPVLPVERVSVR